MSGALVQVEKDVLICCNDLRGELLNLVTILDGNPWCRDCKESMHEWC